MAKHDPSPRSVLIRPILLALFSAALFGAAAPVGKSLLRSFSPYQLAGLLYLGAAMGVLPLVIRNRSLRLPWSIGRRAGLLLAGAILFGGILAPVFMLLGLRLASAASVSLWLPLELVATAVLGRWLFKEHLGPQTVAGLLGVVTVGVMLGVGEPAAGLLAGLLVFFACVCWGADNNCTALIDGITPAEITWWKGVVAGGVNLGIGLGVGGSAGSVGLAGGALVVGALSYGISIVLYISAAQSLGATRAQMFFASGPFFGVVLSAVILGEHISGVQTIAASVLIVSLLLVFRDRHAHEHVHTPITHEHAHRHDDGHHNHAHPDLPASHWHSHPHAHEKIVHSHSHWPDLHHRHSH